MYFKNPQINSCQYGSWSILTWEHRDCFIVRGLWGSEAPQMIYIFSLTNENLDEKDKGLR